MKLNLGSGKTPLDGFVNVDISLKGKADFILDLLQFPWPWEDGTVEEINCTHFLEHIGDEFFPFVDECYRVLKPGALFRIRSPYYTSMRAVQDPTHKRFICEATFEYLNAERRKILAVDHYPVVCDFDIKEMRFHFPTGMAELSEEERKYLLTHAWNTAADIEVLLVKNDPINQSLDRQTNKSILLT